MASVVPDLKSLFLFLVISCLSVVTFLVTSINALDAYSESQVSDKVGTLPGQPSSPPISHFSGYITVDKDHERSLFYWFFEAQSEPSKKPLVLWLNGGPGCSSVGYGAAVELGPLRVDKDGATLQYNEFSWNKEANLLFVESPVGVGFSYSKTPSDFSKLDDAFVAEDTYNFLVNWLQRFPQYKAFDFFIAGESYGGHYVPQLAELIYDRNKETTNDQLINLKGFLVGNPETDDYYDSKGLLEYAWSHAVISDQLYDKAKQMCDFKVTNWSQECIDEMSKLYSEYKEIDIYNIYEPICLINGTPSSLANAKFNINGLKRMRLTRLPGGYDPCYSNYTKKYFNRLDVQLSMHVNTEATNVAAKWSVCNGSLLNTYIYNVFSVLPIYTKLIKSGLKMWIYSGDADGRVPVIGSRYCIEALGLPSKSPWHNWYHEKQVGGRIVEYEGLTFVTIRGAGHLVPLNKPSEALSIFHSFLTGQGLPTQR